VQKVGTNFSYSYVDADMSELLNRYLFFRYMKIFFYLTSQIALYSLIKSLI